MYAIPVSSTCCNYVYTYVPVLRTSTRMNIIEEGGVAANGDVTSYAVAGKRLVLEKGDNGGR